jgi:serine/threonine protein kinase
MELKTNTKLKNDTYTIISVLGQGGFGITYKAITHGAVSGVLGGVKVDIPVAVKEFFMKDACVRDDVTSSVSIPTKGGKEQIERYKKKFIKEAYNLSKLNHPNIVKVIDVFEENNTVYYVMQFLKNSSLRHYMKEHGVMNEEQATKYILQIANALKYMHSERHMCHFDVKPSNILLDDYYNAKLIDFGISKNYDEGGNETSSTPIGISKGYAPLEQYRQSIHEFSPTSDIYSLGATFYTLITGKVPPEASDVLDNGIPEKPIDVSTKVWDVIKKAMSPRKKDRYQSMDEFINALSEKKNVPVIDDDAETKILDSGLETQTINKDSQKQPSFLTTNKYKILAAIAALAIILLLTFALSNFKVKDEGQPTKSEVITTEKVQISEMDYVLKGEDGNSDVKFHYQGEVVEGCPEGKGVGTYQEGVYEGTYHAGKREDTYATMKLFNGDIYQGSWVNDYYEKGRYTLKESGMYFEGEFKKGDPYNGTYYNRDGSESVKVINGEEV